MTTETANAQDPAENSPKKAAGLTIGDLARRTGVHAATLRMWEARYGFPKAERLPSGHRRFTERTVDEVFQVLRQRDAGARLEAAIAGIAAAPEIPAPSVFADLRHRHPHLVPRTLRKSTLLALTWALEDECCARAQQPWLFGAFQREEFFRQAERRWHDLARTAKGAWALADFPAGSSPDSARPVEVALPESATIRREWSLVCLAADFPGALAAWELPGQDGTPDGDRLFESVWTLEPGPVQDAARCCARIVADLGHDTSAVLADADRPLVPVAGGLRHATGLFSRVLAYVDQVR